MTIEMIIGAAVVVLLIAIAIKHRAKPVDMDHQAPNVHNVQMKGKVGPATAADKAAAPAPAKKKVAKKKPTKKVTAKKETATAVDFSKMTKAELEEAGRKMGIELDKRKKKADLVAQLEAASKK
jgi:type II secretory pathway component HofQ